MKHSAILSRFKWIITLLLFNFIQTILWAQDSGSTKTSTTTTHVSSTTDQATNWYASPWVWVVGAAILILLIVALSSGSRRNDSSKSDKVTVTKSVRRDTDV